MSPVPACGAAAGPGQELPANSSSAACEVYLLLTSSAVKTWERCLFAQAALRKVAALGGGHAELLLAGPDPQVVDGRCGRVGRFLGFILVPFYRKKSGPFKSFAFSLVLTI